MLLPSCRCPRPRGSLKTRRSRSRRDTTHWYSHRRPPARAWASTGTPSPSRSSTARSCTWELGASACPRRRAEAGGLLPAARACWADRRAISERMLEARAGIDQAEAGREALLVQTLAPASSPGAARTDSLGRMNDQRHRSERRPSSSMSSGTSSPATASCTSARCSRTMRSAPRRNGRTTSPWVE